MSDRPRLEQFRIMFDRDDLAEIKNYAKAADQSFSMWIEEAVKDRLDSRDFNKIPVKKGDERVRVSLLRGLVEEIEASFPVDDLKIWVKEAIQMKIHAIKKEAL